MEGARSPEPPATPLAGRATVAGAAEGILQHGEDTWPLWVFEFVDDFRATLDPRLAADPPTSDLTPRLRALLACVVEALCSELGLPTPEWSLATPPLAHPWFVSGVENLKAMALVESPAWFRRRNVFVLGNFLNRA
jgi:hypothetical protein